MVRGCRLRWVATGVTALLGLVTGCGDDDEGAPTRTLTVLAASSLTTAFDQIATSFEARHEGLDVRVTYDGSSALATQIEEGVPVDVFASADEATLARVRSAGLGQSEPVVFATNRLRIAVPAGNPAGVARLEDLVDGDLRLALCAAEVPCGRYAAQAFAAAGLEVPTASQEENVRGVLTKVALGEADAGLVYATDIRGHAAVEGIDLPADVQVTVRYPATARRDARNPAAAAAFVSFLLDEEAQSILERSGFGPASGA